MHEREINSAAMPLQGETDKTRTKGYKMHGISSMCQSACRLQAQHELTKGRKNVALTRKKKKKCRQEIKRRYFKKR
jgi:hypothetical protein